MEVLKTTLTATQARANLYCVIDEFEAIAIPIIRRHNGELVLRVRPASGSLIEGIVELPYEIHIVFFPTQDDCDSFAQDDERK